MTDSPPHPEWPDDFDESEWYFAPDAIGVFRVVTAAMEYVAAEEQCRGTLEINPLTGEPETLDADQVRELGLPDRVFHVPPRVVSDPGRVLAEFAAQELTNYNTTLGSGHAYSGIDGIDTIRDLILADKFWSASQIATQTVDIRFTTDGISASAYDEDGTVLDEGWFTWDEVEKMKSDEESHITFEL